jgi:uncharacterized protein
VLMERNVLAKAAVSLGVVAALAMAIGLANRHDQTADPGADSQSSAPTSTPTSAPTSVLLNAPTVAASSIAASSIAVAAPPVASSETTTTITRSIATESLSTIQGSLVKAADSQIGVTTGYDPTYVRLAFPGGDVDITTGVCSDVIIRSYRAIGVDLQEQLNSDMRAHFSKYPTRWGLTKPDANIDHRRVPNLETFFARKGASLGVSNQGSDYLPGDVVTWRIAGQLPHTGLVSSTTVDGSDRFLIVHNVGQGTRKEDVLFTWPITGHYRWLPE